MSDSNSVRLAIVILAVDDVERSAAFYESVFGWRRVVDLPIYIEYAIGGSVRVSLYERNTYAMNTGIQPSRAEPGATTSTELYMRMDKADEVLDTIERLRTAGARELDALKPRPWGDDAAYFADPDGNVVAVSRPLE